MRAAGSLALIVAGLALAAGAAWPRAEGGARLYVRPKPVVLGLWFNPHSPLFRDNTELERAINFALDRPALIRARGRFAGHPTARILPPGVPRSPARSPYPLDGPHLATAQLLADGNLRDGKATLQVNYGFQRLGQEVKRELAEIGIDVSVNVYRPCQARACSPDEADLYVIAWGADYPDPASAFMYFDRRWPESPQLAPPFPAQLARALRLSGSERVQAFTQLDGDVMAKAPPVAPFMTLNAAMLLSARTHCFNWNVYYGVDLNALCVR